MDDDRPARRRPPVQQLELRCGRFADTAAGVSDELRVIVRDFDDRQFFDVGTKWTPRPGPVYPQAGDLAFIQEVRGDDYTGWVVTLWEPA